MSQGLVTKPDEVAPSPTVGEEPSASAPKPRRKWLRGRLLTLCLAEVAK